MRRNLGRSISREKRRGINPQVPLVLINNKEKKKEEMLLNKQQILEIYERNKINYESLKQTCEFNLVNTDEVDVSIIIPVKGRENFNAPLVKHLIDAMDFFKEKTYSITFVEHSEESTHRALCKDNTNHIWIRQGLGAFFNKCLAMNVGALFSNKAKYYLFHDIDLLVDNTFFANIFSNLSKIPEGSALQAFGGRKVVVMSKDLTDLILRNRLKITEVNPGGDMAPYSNPGAPGGSIFIGHASFFRIGGFDPEFFHSYSCEDAFFYHKAEVTVGIRGCDDPVVETFHMDHPRTNGADNPDRHLQNRINDGFISFNSEDKTNFIAHLSNSFKKSIQ